MRGSVASNAKRFKTFYNTVVLDAWSAVLPIRIANEELGDCIEDIHRRAAIGQSAWRIYLRMVSGMFWTAINALGYLRKTLSGNKSVS